MLDTVVEPVARKTAKKAEADDKSRKPMVLQVRGSDEFKAWYQELARFDGLTDTALFDRAIRQYAKMVGFVKDAPIR